MQVILGVCFLDCEYILLRVQRETLAPISPTFASYSKSSQYM